MNRIQKAVTVFVALTITLVGATLATAPLGLVDVRPAASHQGKSSFAQSATAWMGAMGSRRG